MIALAGVVVRVLLAAAARVLPALALAARVLPAGAARAARVLPALAVAAVVLPAPAAAGQSLTGEWLNSGYTVSSYQLHSSAGGSKLTATWNDNVGGVMEGLVGRFTGTLNSAGTAYSGSMSVREGSVYVGGTMTVAISPQAKFGYPLLDVSYQQDNGVTGNFRLEIWLLPPQLGAGPSASFEYYCPGPRACQGVAQAVQGSGAGGVVGSARFSIAGGHARAIKVSLNKTGLRLVAQRHSLRVSVLLTALSKSSPLPYLTALGTLTLRAK